MSAYLSNLFLALIFKLWLFVRSPILQASLKAVDSILSPLMTVVPGHGDYPDTGGPGKQSPAIITDYYNTGSHPATSDAKITA